MGKFNDIYLNKFIENGFDNLQAIKLLTDHDLISIGTDKLGHRKLMIRAIQNIH